MAFLVAFHGVLEPGFRGVSALSRLACVFMTFLVVFSRRLQGIPARFSWCFLCFHSVFRGIFALFSMFCRGFLCGVTLRSLIVTYR